MLRGAFYAFLIIFCLLPIKKKRMIIRKGKQTNPSYVHWRQNQ
jgi:hypothetical protein